jgi:hypothetical protein
VPFDAVSMAERVLVFCDAMTCGSADSQRRAVSGRTSTPGGLIQLRVRHIVETNCGHESFLMYRTSHAADAERDAWGFWLGPPPA